MSLSTAVNSSAVARVLGIETQYKNLRNNTALILPRRIAVIGQGNTASTYATTKLLVTDAQTVGQTYGFGSPLHLAALQLLPSNGDGVGTIPVVIFPLVDDAAGVAAAGAITPTGTATKSGTFRVVINNILSAQFTVAVGDTVADVTALITTAVNGVLKMPVTAVDNSTDVTVTAKWKGASGNDIYLAISGPSDTGIDFGFTQPTGGAGNPEIDAALALMGEVWYTDVLLCLNYDDTVALDTIQTEGEGRYDPLLNIPFTVFRGCTEADRATAVAVGAARTEDRVNIQINAPGCLDLPFTVAARAVSRIAVRANTTPPRDYGSMELTGITPGEDSEQWGYADRNVAVLAGSSTTLIRDDVVVLQDVVTHYAPEGDPTPAYRYQVDIVKVQNVTYNLRLAFNTADWDGAPLIPDDQATTEPTARKPKDAVATVGSIMDSFGLKAVISDPDFAKENTFAEIDDSNPKRLNISTTYKLSGNSNIISVTQNFGFYYGVSAVS